MMNEKELSWNGQIVRFFDENDNEYDLPSANKQIWQSVPIYVYVWGGSDGYFFSKKIQKYFCGDCGEEISQEQYESVGDLCGDCEQAYYKETY